jgi:hypothetical protein
MPASLFMTPPPEYAGRGFWAKKFPRGDTGEYKMAVGVQKPMAFAPRIACGKPLLGRVTL